MQYVVFMILAPLTSVAIVICLAMVWRRPQKQQAFLAACILASALGFLVTNALELAWPNPAGTMLFAKLSYLFSTPVPVLFLLFVFQFTGYAPWWRGWRSALLFAIPAASAALAALEPSTGLIWRSVSFTPVHGMLAMSVTYGWFFWLLEAYTVGILVHGVFLLFREYAVGERLYRRQSVLLVVAAVIPLAVFLLYALKAIPGLTKNYAPIAYGVCSILIMGGIRQVRLLDLLPVARGLLMDEMADALILLNPAGRILDANAAARSVLGLDGRAVGEDVRRFPAIAGLLDLGAAGAGRREVTLEQWGARRFFDARVTRLTRPAGAGLLVTLRDVTEAHELLEEKNRLIGQLTHALAEIRTLQGIIPICLSCKKIRDDAGYWHQVESYVGERSNAQFSHGLCPECREKQGRRQAG
jgi:PAS domain-containing protein